MEKEDSEYKIGFTRIFLLIISLIILSHISTFSFNSELTKRVLAFIAYISVILAGMSVNVVILSFTNSIPRRDYGFSIIVKSVLNSFAFMFPFAVISIFSEALFNWNAIQGIISSAIFTCVFLSSAELIKLGGHKTGNIISSFVVSFIVLLFYSMVKVILDLI